MISEVCPTITCRLFIKMEETWIKISAPYQTLRKSEHKFLVSLVSLVMEGYSGLGRSGKGRENKGVQEFQCPLILPFL